jgi:hypothetical protein
VAYSDCSICILEKIADWTPYNITASKNYSILALKVYSTFLQQDHDALGCTWGEERAASPLRKLSNVVCAEAINILLIRDGRGYFILRKMSRNWELDQNAVDSRVMVEAGNLFDKLGFRDSIRIMEKFAVDTCL